MENIKTFENIGEFSLHLKRAALESDALSYFIVIKDAHENSFGGCGCNRKNRIANAIETYKKIIVEATDQNVQKLKINLNVEKISFKQDGLEFAKF